MISHCVGQVRRRRLTAPLWRGTRPGRACQGPDQGLQRLADGLGLRQGGPRKARGAGSNVILAGRYRRLAATGNRRPARPCVGFVLALPLWLGACAGSVADPVEVIGGPTPGAERIKVDPSPDDAPFPSLGSVPETRPRPSAQRRRDGLTSRLIADRLNARYSGERLTSRNTAIPSARPPVPSASSRPQASSGQLRNARPSSRSAPPGPPPRLPEAPRPLAAPGQAAPLPPIAPPAAESAAVKSITSLRPSEQAPAAATDPIAQGQLVGVIQFLDGSSRVDVRDRQILRDVLLLQRQRGGVIRLIGHASQRRVLPDPIAHRVVKFERSLARASSVALAMLELGADRKALEVIAAADSEPVYDESEATGEAGNRRVEIFLEY